MDLLESIWFLISSLIIIIVLLVDPKSSLTGSSNNILGFTNSGGQFIYKFSAVLIVSFFMLTTVLSLNN